MWSDWWVWPWNRHNIIFFVPAKCPDEWLCGMLRKLYISGRNNQDFPYFSKSPRMLIPFSQIRNYLWKVCYADPLWGLSTPQWSCLFYAEGFHSGDYGHHMGIHCNVACVSIEIQIISNLFWTLEAICHCILVAAQCCFLIKKSGYTVQYWIFRTAQKGYLRRGL